MPGVALSAGAFSAVALSVAVRAGDVGGVTLCVVALSVMALSEPVDGFVVASDVADGAAPEVIEQGTAGWEADVAVAADVVLAVLPVEAGVVPPFGAPAAEVAVAVPAPVTVVVPLAVAPSRVREVVPI
ncbi:hypothetical protein [Geodermatophilus sp. TF02-6]|uniref:hypothetical protein n=1 Tax=Geodermatophilus sp. TF02-6 TaxID=2250575 RepID=UPI0011BF084E|nr:hypothetical protein [Geodermatophilus sp. TF02-6]